MSTDKKEEVTFDDDFTGTNAQADPDFLFERERNPGGDGLSELEDELLEITQEDIEEDSFVVDLDYDEFLVLSKKDVSAFLRVVEPWTKVTVGLYGDCVQISSVDEGKVKLNYINHPMFATSTIANHSKKKIPTVYVNVAHLKRIVTESYASVILVWKDDSLNLSVASSLVYVETVQLQPLEYNEIVVPEDHSNTLSPDIANTIFKKLNFALDVSDRASEQVVIFTNGASYLNTLAVAAKINQPFSEPIEGVFFKGVVAHLGTLLAMAKQPLMFHFDENFAHINLDNKIFTRVPISRDVSKFYHPQTEHFFQKTTEIKIVNDNLLKIASLVKAFDYLNKVIALTFLDQELTVTIMSHSLKRKDDIKFPIQASSKVDASLQISSALLVPFLSVSGSDVSYGVNDMGLSVITEQGVLLLKKRS